MIFSQQFVENHIEDHKEFEKRLIEIANKLSEIRYGHFHNNHNPCDFDYYKEHIIVSKHYKDDFDEIYVPIEYLWTKDEEWIKKEK